MSEISGGLPQPIILQAAKSQGAAQAAPFVQAEGKLAGEKPGDVLEFSYRQAKVPPEDKRKEHFAKAGEHFITSLKYQLGAVPLAWAGAALAPAVPPLGLGLMVAGAGMYLYGGLAHGWPAAYHAVKGAFTPKQTAQA
jgi:hypothetical protein